MDLESHESAASVALAHVRISEDELEVYEATLNYVLEVMSPDEIETRLGGDVDLLEGMRDDISSILEFLRLTYHEPLPAEAQRQA
jgi:hypothetical protein